MTDLNELSRLLEHATPGPWKVYRFFPYIFEVCSSNNYSTGPVCTTPQEANSYLIAALRNCAEELIRDARACAEIRRVIALGKDDGSVGRVARRAIAQEQP